MSNGNIDNSCTVDKRNIALKGSLHIYSNLIIKILQFIGLIFVARLLGPTPMGTIGYAAGIVGLFSIIANMGFSTAHRKKISEGKDLGRCIGTYFTIRMILMVIWISALLLWVNYSKYVSHSFILTQEEEYVLYIVATYTVVYGHSGIMRHTFWAKLEPSKSAIPKIIARVLTVSLKIIVAILGLSVIYLASAQLIGYIFLIILLLYFFRNYPFKLPSKDYLKDYIIFTIPLMLTIPMDMIAVHSDATMIGYFWGVEQVAYYAASMQIAHALILIGGTVGLVLLPLISASHKSKDFEYIRTIVTRTERYLMLFMVPLVVFNVFYAEEIVMLLLGGKFGPAAPIFQIQMLIVAIIAVTRPYSTQLISTGYLKLTFIVGIVISIPHILLNFIFIPETFYGVEMLGKGALGAAYASLIGLLIGQFLVRYFAYKTVGTRCEMRVLLIPFSGLVMFAVMIVIDSIAQSDLLIRIFPIGFLGFFSYLTILIFFRELTKKDWKLICQITSPSKMRNYIKNELKE